MRWNLGWPNPNPAGAFMAMLIVCCWCLQGLAGRLTKRPLWRPGWVALILVIELVLWFLLLKTYSRGALVAVLCGAVCRLLIGAGPDWQRWISVTSCVPVLVRGAAIGILLVTTDFIGRATIGYISGDASVTNRLELWAAGLRMIAAEPLRGWGAGESGAQFMHWFQGINASDGYAGMVNSWLHRAVEHGLPAVLPWLWLVLALISVAWLLATRQRGTCVSEFVVAVASVWVVFAVANFFSTLWIYGSLWVLPVLSLIACGAVVVCTVRRRLLTRRAVAFCLIGSLATAVGALVAVLVTAAVLAKGGDPAVAPQYVAFGKERPRQWLLAADSGVLGRDYGKAARLLAGQLIHRETGLAVLRQGRDGGGIHVDVLVLAGEHCAFPPNGITAPQLILVHPSGPPRDFPKFHSVAVFVPALDTHEYARQWREHATVRGWAIHSSGAIGEDIRAVWPQALVAAWRRSG